jgi:hypothetical protein
MHTHSIKEKPQGWRDNWFVKNVLAEIPIIGGFFQTASIPEVLHLGGKSAAMLIGGSTVMMFNLLGSHEHEDMAVGMTKMTANMAIGMAGGTIVYNTAFSLGKSTYHCFFPPAPQHQLETESETADNPLTDDDEKKSLLGGKSASFGTS